ncbi:putative RNA-binding Zn ribbon-like protein [Lipingzhangella halophila]|uniref:Putative RNA-binding Zn ribbon-like protein n=1 Tax=Lipingzhangella halophila TaxID=1783352 RepID=A0A7W7W4K2_9ACTN|nr:CGNR zinc finger domain-containing protein [Lipingzhangella halophila]MBB4932820.1 putative RNA-binding Zn ribbon-like protein [Lipingzhangella halophila]
MNIPFSDYASGAGVATALVNTAPRVRSDGDGLAGTAALADFLTEHGLAPEALDGGGRPAAPDVIAVHRLREETRAALESESEDELAAAAEALVARAGAGPRLYRDSGGRWRWAVATVEGAALADELAVLIGVGLLGVLHSLGGRRFRACASPACEGVFVDTSRAGRRRFCMPEVCGNRVNVANHRARRRAAGA